MNRAGYILVETIVSMGLLSISMLMIQANIRQAVITRGQAQDYTTARILLDDIVGRQLIQTVLSSLSDKGQFPAPNERFSYSWKLTRVELPRPPLPPNLDALFQEQLEDLFVDYLGKMQVTIEWTRAGRSFSVEGETLIGPSKYWNEKPRGPRI
jgi:hypothetical protein